MSFLYLAVVSILAGAPQANQPPASTAASSSTPSSASTSDTEDLPVSLERIQRALARTPALRLDSKGRSVFRVEVFGRKPTVEDILGPDYLKGPVPYGGMTHQEFLSLVTPKDVQGYAAFNNKEAMTVAATSIALQWALQRAIHKYETAKQERELEAARKEVQDALAELAKARQRAGLPPK